MFYRNSNNKLTAHSKISLEGESHFPPSCDVLGGGIRNLAMKRRHFMRLVLASVGLAIPHLVQAYQHKDKAKAIAWLPAEAIGIELVNASFELHENIRGDLRTWNTLDRTHSGLVSYEIVDLDTERTEVSETVTLVVDPGDNQFSFSCDGCQTVGEKRLTITTAYGSESIDFVVVAADL